MHAGVPNFEKAILSLRRSVFDPHDPLMLKRKYVNTAVVLADSFNQRFTPVTLEVPRCLIPLVNAPMLDYTIEFLLANNIENIFVFCVTHADMVQEYLAQSQWADHVKCIVSSSVSTLGDALRRIQDENVIESDFVLLHADVVANLPLEKVLLKHRLAKEKDPTVLMTTVYKKATPLHASRSLEDDTIVGLSDTGEILFVDNDPHSIAIEIDPMLILQSDLRLHYDLIDTHIDICSVEVLQLFKDNFDYQNVRGEFIKGVMGDDITDHRLFAHIVSNNHYATRVKDLRTYASVTRDIIHRWTAPVVVDNSLLDPLSTYRLRRGFVHLEHNVKLHPRTKIGSHTVMGSGTTVGAGTIISRSVIGRDCTIGSNCSIINSFLLGSVTVDDNARIEWSVLCSKVRIFVGVTIGRGCMLSFGVHVGPAVAVKNNTRLTTLQGEGCSRNMDLGDKGVGFQWIDEDADFLVSGGRKASLTGHDSDNDTMFTSSTPLIDESDVFDTDSELDPAASGVMATDFDLEVREIVLEGVQLGHSVENLALEINGRKFAHDKTFLDCVRCILYAFMKSVPEDVAEGKPLLTALQKVLKKYRGLLAKFLQEDEVSEIIWALQEFCEDKQLARFASTFPFVLHTLYDIDLVDEESIFEWEKEQASLMGEDRRFLEMSSKFLEWLREADDDSSD